MIRKRNEPRNSITLQTREQRETIFGIWPTERDLLLALRALEPDDADRLLGAICLKLAGDIVFSGSPLARVYWALCTTLGRSTEIGRAVIDVEGTAEHENEAEHIAPLLPEKIF
jgi:hypothetical protein